MRAGYKQTAVGVIPEDWEVQAMGSIGDALIGLTYSPSDVQEFGTLVLRSSNIQNGRLTFDDNVFVEMDIPDRAITRKNDILICVRNGSRHLIGKCALIDEKTAGSAFGAFMSIFRSVQNEFVLHQLKSKVIQQQINKVLGATINQITSRELCRFQIPLPSTKTEQEAIAGTLSDADGLIESLEQLITKKRYLKQGAMQQLLTGKKRLVGFETNLEYKQTEIGTIPGDWDIVSFDRAFLFLATSTYSRAQASGGAVDYVHYGDIHTRWNSFLDFNNATLPRVTTAQASRFPMIRDGDLIIVDASEDHDGIGKLIEVRNLGDRKAIAGLHTFLLRNRDNTVAVGYRGYIWSNRLVKSQFDRLATGMKVYGVSRANLKLVKIPLPPTLTEQTAIAAVLSDMDAEIQALEIKLGKARQIRQGMMQKLLTGQIRFI